MEVVVCVGWRGGDPDRERNFAVVQQHYRSMGLPIVTADSDPAQPFLLPRALNRAVDGAVAGGADVVIVSDADVLISQEQLEHAVQRAVEMQRLVHPVTRYWRLDRAGRPPAEPERYFAGGIHVFGRSAWLDLGGYDERFAGWAPHDAAMLWAAATFLRVEQADGDVFHLWHPQSSDWQATEGWMDAVEVLGASAPPGYGDSGPRPVSPLALRYRAALYDQLAMDALLREPERRRGGYDGLRVGRRDQTVEVGRGAVRG